MRTQRAGDSLRITAHLVHARDEFDLWSQRFDRTADDVFAMQDEVARAVVAALDRIAVSARPRIQAARSRLLARLRATY